MTATDGAKRVLQADPLLVSDREGNIPARTSQGHSGILSLPLAAPLTAANKMGEELLLALRPICAI